MGGQGDDGPQTAVEAKTRSESPRIPLSEWALDQLYETAEECLVSPSKQHFRQSSPVKRGLFSSSSSASVSNWGGTFVCSPKCIFAPRSIEQCCVLVELARRLGDVECRAIGRSHSPGDVQFTKGWLIQMNNLSGLLSIDVTGQAPSITVLAGTYISDMHKMLESAPTPLAMRNLGSISEQTIGGLISTASHGTGVNSPVLSVAVQSLRVVCALNYSEGGTQVIRCSRTSHPDLFNATLCGLGATGVIVEVTLNVDYWYKLKQVAEECKFDMLFGAPTSSPAYSVRLSAVKDFNVLEPQAGKEESLLIDKKNAELAETFSENTAVNLGKLLARRPKLFPACPDARLPTFSNENSSAIYPADIHGAQSRAAVVGRDGIETLDDASRVAQRNLEALAYSAQHVRIAWFPSAGMCTVMRMNRTLEPIQRPGFFSRIYQDVVGYHLLQPMLFYGRYRPSSLPRINRLNYHLTHPAPKKEDLSTTPSSAPTLSTPAPDLISRVEANSATDRDGEKQSKVENDVDHFKAGSFDPRQLKAQIDDGSASASYAPLDPRNPQTVLVDAAPQVFNVNCLFRQYTDEWAIPLSQAAIALRVMRDWLREEEQMVNGEPVHFPVEVRFVDADGIWLSPCHGRKTCYIGIVQYRPYNLPVRYRALFDKFERLMRFFGGRPHWAKAHTCGSSELLRLYPDLPKFLKVRQRVDPEGVFLNPYIRRHLLSDISPEAAPRLFKSRL